jgi:hypothetical protein
MRLTDESPRMGKNTNSGRLSQPRPSKPPRRVSFPLSDWNALLEGGGKEQACGWLIDRFGLRWQIVPAVLDEMMHDKDPVRSKRVTDELLEMVKIDIATLQKAYGS